MAEFCTVVLIVFGLLVAVAIVTIAFNPTAHWHHKGKVNDTKMDS